MTVRARGGSGDRRLRLLGRLGLGRSGLLGLSLANGCRDALEGDARVGTQVEVVTAGTEADLRTSDVGDDAELFGLHSDLAHEGGRECAEVSELDDRAVGDDLTGDLGGVVDHRLDFLLGEGGSTSHTTAEVTELNPTARGDLSLEDVTTLGGVLGVTRVNENPFLEIKANGVRCYLSRHNI